MRYVDAGYIIALVTLFAYGLGLALRRRRWERARAVAQATEEPVVPGARS